MKNLIGSTIALAFAATVLVGCGDDAGDDYLQDMVDDMDSAAACSDVWVDGKTLPKDYEGCNDEDDTFVVLVTSGDCGLATYEGDTEFYALLGGEITEVPALADDPGYAKAFEDC